MKNILFAGIFHETNCFLLEKTKMKDFDILKNNEIFELKGDCSQVSLFSLRIYSVKRSPEGVGERDMPVFRGSRRPLFFVGGETSPQPFDFYFCNPFLY